MNRKDLIDELKRRRDSGDLRPADAMQLDKAIDVLLNNYSFLNVVDGFRIGGATVEFSVDKETGVLFCAYHGLSPLPVTQKELDNAAEVVKNIHRKLEKILQE